MRKRLYSLPLDEEEGEPQINLTPLIDVVFVILIGFMLLAPLLHKETVDLAEGGKESVQRASFTITLKKDRSIWVQGKEVSLERLSFLAKNFREKNPTLLPQIVPDTQAPFGLYQDVKNALEASGFSQVDVILQPK